MRISGSATFHLVRERNTARRRGDLFSNVRVLTVLSAMSLT